MNYDTIGHDRIRTTGQEEDRTTPRERETATRCRNNRQLKNDVAGY